MEFEYEQTYYEMLRAKERGQAFQNRLEYIGRILRDVPLRGACVLDIGCGIGGTMKWLHQTHPELSKVIGTDISASALTLARKEFTQEPQNVFEFRLALARTQPCENESCDLVVATELIEHLEESSGFLSEVFRVLKPGGYLMLTTAPNRLSLSWLCARLRGASMEKDHHLKLYTSFSLMRSCERVGFKMLRNQVHQVYVFSQFMSQLRPLDGLLECVFDFLPNVFQWFVGMRLFCLAQKPLRIANQESRIRN